MMTLLACPRCGGDLVSSANALECKPCKVTFPKVGGVPWLWPEPGPALLDWRNRCNRLLGEIESELSTPLPSDAGSHVLRYQSGLKAYRAQIGKLLEPLKVGELLATEVHNALRTPFAEHHAADSYMQNVFRDWCWGEEETREVTDYLVGVLQAEGAQVQSIAVLGSGAGRLAWELHHALGAENTVALDSNPLLCLIAEALFAGRTMTLTEFPRAPLGAEDYAVEQQLQPPGASTENGLISLCADATRPPLRAAGFDLVVTPWLIDVLDLPVREQLPLFAGLLKEGGYWLNHGSLAFAAKNPLERHSPETLARLAEASGFDVTLNEARPLPYLQSPHNRQRRVEITQTLLARRNGERVTSSPPGSQPDWMDKTDQVVPLDPRFQTQLTTTRVHAFIMGLVDGKRSINDMAKVLEDQRLMPAREATAAIRRFLKVMLNEADQQDRLG